MQLVKPATFLVLVLLLPIGCARHNALPGPDQFSCGVPHCALARVPGVRLVRDDDGRALLHEATGARVAIEYLDGRPGAVDALLARWRERLAPVVDWRQPPDAASGFRVRGLTGQRRPPAGVFVDPDPVRVWLATWENPATGSVLVLRTAAPASVWDRAWADLEPVLTRVAFTPRF